MNGREIILKYLEKLIQKIIPKLLFFIIKIKIYFIEYNILDEKENNCDL